jgi:hypothetical protein
MSWLLINTATALGGLFILVLVGAWWANRAQPLSFWAGFADGIILANGVSLGAVLLVLGVTSLLGY